MITEIDFKVKGEERKKLAYAIVSDGTLWEEQTAL